MEIERKWMVAGWPECLPLTETFEMDQGYLCVRPTVRIRREAKAGGRTAYVLCFKGQADPTGLVRQESETEAGETRGSPLADLIGKPLIAKERRSYALSGGLTLEVNEVDRGQPGQFFYAEIEYPTAEAARSWTPSADGLTAYLADEVTGRPGASMGEYWQRTRGDVAQGGTV